MDIACHVSSPWYDYFRHAPVRTHVLCLKNRVFDDWGLISRLPSMESLQLIQPVCTSLSRLREEEIPISLRNRRLNLIVKRIIDLDLWSDDPDIISRWLRRHFACGEDYHFIIPIVRMADVTTSCHWHN